MTNTTTRKKLTKLQKGLIIAAAIILVLAIVAGVLGLNGDWKKIYRGLKVIGFNAENKKVVQNEVVFVGDSITDYCDLAQFYPGFTAYNRGISADTTDGLLYKRMDASIFDLNPRVIVLLMGINDLAFFDRTPDEVLTNFRDIFKAIKEKLPNAQVIVQSIYPVANVDYKGIVERTQDKIPLVNAGLEILATEYGYQYVNTSPLLADENGRLNPSLSNDGLHPNEEGYKVISAFLTPYIEAAYAVPLPAAA